MSENETEVPPLKLPSYRYTTGWHCIGWDDDFPVGEVRSLHYFGQDLVAWRGESGQVFVLDAHCQHLGGNMGVGGHVEGDCIVCPWHNWHWNGDGSNALIPYSRLERNPTARVFAWPVREWYGMVVVWHDRDRCEPHWELPEVPEAKDPRFFPLAPSRQLHRIKAHPQMIIENAADPYHVGPIHGGTATKTTSFEPNGHHLHATISNVYGEGRESTWLTPDGPVEATITYDTYALGVGFVRFPANPLESVQITAHTPVDETHTDYYFMQTSERDPGEDGDVPTGRAARFLKIQQNLVTQDFFLWEHMKHLDRPNFTPEEARDYVALRRWAQQFYPPGTLE